jgi:hypothetical protein
MPQAYYASGAKMQDSKARVIRRNWPVWRGPALSEVEGGFRPRLLPRVQVVARRP